MKFWLQVEVDEKETSLTSRELVDVALRALAEAYMACGCYYDIGVNPEHIGLGKPS